MITKKDFKNANDYWNFGKKLDPCKDHYFKYDYKELSKDFNASQACIKEALTTYKFGSRIFYN